MPKEFVMRGRTASGETEVLNIGSQARPGYGYIMTEFLLYFGEDIGGAGKELAGTVTAGKTAVAPLEPDFTNAGLIATSLCFASGSTDNPDHWTVVNDLYIITQDLILMVQDKSGNDGFTNWQCRFREVKLTSAAEAVANYKQYTVFNS